jgi:glycosyltransferase involved in cell wall biosynthesis
MILGGAQENTLLNCLDLVQRHGDEVLLVTGPAEGPEGSLLEQARAGEVPLAILPDLVREIHPWHDARAYFAVSQALADFKPDVVHTHSAKGGVIGRIAAWRLGVPAVVHTVHGAPFYPAQNALMYEFSRWAEWWAARHCHALISVADAMTDQLVAAGVAPREKFTTIYSGMEVEPFLAADEHRERMRRQLGYGPDDVVIGKIARLFELKGHDDVIAAAKEVVRRVSRAKFLFVGDGILRAELERQIATAGLSAHFQFVGLVPPTEIPAYLSAMDLVIHASLREGLARVLPQALLAGKPVVSYDVDGAREVVVNDETGFLLPPRDIAALTSAVVELASDPALRERLGTSRRAQLAQQFDHRHMTKQIRSLYEDVLARGRGG